MSVLQGKARTPILEVILHCAAINTGQFANMSPFQMFCEVNEWHKERKFKNGFGYHGLIAPDGDAYHGRPLDMVGAHCLGHNQGTIGILLIESRKIKEPDYVKTPAQLQAWLATRSFDDWFTQAQRESLTEKLRAFAMMGVKRVSGHNDYASRACPGFKVRACDWIQDAIRQ